jgi:cobalt-zinc-cadmium efflux system membrane fusion protein
LLAGMALMTVGCGKEKDKGPAAQASDKPKAHDHGAWWCAEHGLPEAVCWQCNGEYAAACQKKGDWCKEHERPESECFVCHPELKEKFTDQYRKKYGKDPPPMEEETPKK